MCVISRTYKEIYVDFATKYGHPEQRVANIGLCKLAPNKKTAQKEMFRDAYLYLDGV